MKEFKDLDFGQKIKSLREDKKLSQGKLAKISGVSVAEICRIEKGERKNPSINLVNKLLKGLEVNEDVYMQVVGFNK